MNPTSALSSLQNSNPLLAILWAGISLRQVALYPAPQLGFLHNVEFHVECENRAIFD